MLDQADAQVTRESAREDEVRRSASSTSGISRRSGKEDASAAVSSAAPATRRRQVYLSVVQANVRVAQANRNKIARYVERYRALVAKDEISRETFDQAVSAEQAASASVDSQQAAVTEAQQNIAVAERAVEQSRARLSQADSQVEAAKAGPEQVKGTEARAQAAQARVAQKRAEDQAELNLSYATITALITGIVAWKALQAVDRDRAGRHLAEELFQLKDKKNTRQKASFEVDANGRTYTGKVERIAGQRRRIQFVALENATGNYVRVVQRIPRISIDLAQHNDHASPGYVRQ